MKIEFSASENFLLKKDYTDVIIYILYRLYFILIKLTVSLKNLYLR